jgi:isopentenyl diphosphate isomerase/L-lactate dehydrogenase-like FMN-dependent dehydrogenase
MGMCNLVHPKADAALADAATAMGFPLCLSSAASTSIEDMARMAGRTRGFSFISATRTTPRSRWPTAPE